VAVSYAHGASSHCLEAASQACTARLPMANLRNQTNPGLICVLAEGKAWSLRTCQRQSERYKQCCTWACAHGHVCTCM